MNQDSGTGLDWKTLAAVVLIGCVWLGWQQYMEHRYGTAPTAPAAQMGAPSPDDSGKQASAPSAEVAKTAVPPIVGGGRRNLIEKVETVQSESMDLKLSNFGLSLNEVVLKGYSDRSGAPMRLGAQSLPAVSVLDRLTQQPVEFDMSRSSGTEFLAQAKTTAARIQAQVTFMPSDFAVKYRIEATELASDFGGFAVQMSEHIHEHESGNFFMPAFEFNESVVVHDGSTDRVRVVRNERLEKSYPKASLLGVGSHYFALAALDKSPVMPVGKLVTDSEVVKGQLEYSPVRGSQQQIVEFIVYLGPKSMDAVTRVDEGFAPLVNFGALSWLARPILKLMQVLFQWVGNYGLAIILLTLIVRFLVLPFNVMSFKSMKAMQAIQPQIKSLRERYKEDPQQLNIQMMALMKTNKVNPLGGCLPMLLQLPVFFALYQVLGQSIELYKSPFIFWIQDLSSKDPYYVLPVLMGVAMFLQQKLTPTTMDPAQAKVMMILPVVFSLMMFTLPSGLTLYIFVSTIFGVAQQMYLMREQRGALVTQS